LRVATGAYWAQSAPRISSQHRAVRFDRWFIDADLPGKAGQKADVWSSYDFAVPGIFVMHGARYPAGTAQRFKLAEPVGIEPISRNIEQQAVTPIDESRTAYYFATGLIGQNRDMTEALSTRIDVVMAAFEEDRKIIEAQQRIWNQTDQSIPKVFLPQDKGPHLMRRMIDKLIREEQSLN
jgi:hypothetical protein